MFKRSTKNTEELAKELQEIKKGGQSFDDPDEWKLPRDKEGNGQAVIRFLPLFGDEEQDKVPFVKVMRHGFKQNGVNFYHTCPTTWGEPCPVCEANSIEWEADNTKNKTVYRKNAGDRKRRTAFWCTILVVEDSVNPDNDGKIKKFHIGKKLYEDFMEPKVAGKPPRRPGIRFWDVFEGCNFIIDCTVGDDGFAKYSASEWEGQSSLFSTSDPDEMTKEDIEYAELIESSIYDFSELTKPQKGEDYDSLKAEFDKVIKGKTASKNALDAALNPSAGIENNQPDPDFDPDEDAFTDPLESEQSKTSNEKDAAEIDSLLNGLDLDI